MHNSFLEGWGSSKRLLGGDKEIERIYRVTLAKLEPVLLCSYNAEIPCCREHPRSSYYTYSRVKIIADLIITL